VNIYLLLGLAILFILLVVALGGAVLLLRMSRRTTSLRRLLELADRLEADLKSCRARLQQAHAVMSLNPDLPAASEQEAAHAVDAGLRALLQQRIWIRDRAPTATQKELDDATRNMEQTRERLRPLLQALGQAQSELDSAMREHIRQDSAP
jgi:biopolymer transport protein ExbB/TolQ